MNIYKFLGMRVPDAVADWCDKRLAIYARDPVPLNIKQTLSQTAHIPAFAVLSTLGGVCRSMSFSTIMNAPDDDPYFDRSMPDEKSQVPARLAVAGGLLGAGILALGVGVAAAPVMGVLAAVALGVATPFAAYPVLHTGMIAASAVTLTAVVGVISVPLTAITAVGATAAQIFKKYRNEAPAMGWQVSAAKQEVAISGCELGGHSRTAMDIIAQMPDDQREKFMDKISKKFQGAGTQHCIPKEPEVVRALHISGVKPGGKSAG